MKYILSVLLSLVFISCSVNKHSMDIDLGNEYSFQLNKGEKEIERSNQLIKGYEQIVNNNDYYQVPLYKCIAGSDYKLYIGFVLEVTDLKEFAKNYDSSLKMIGDKNLFCKKYDSNKNIYTSKYVKFSKPYSYLVYVESSDSIQQNTVGSFESINDRIKKK